MPFLGKDRTLFRLFGLPIKANVSWLFLVALVVWSLGDGYFPSQLGGGVPPYVPWLLAAAGAALLFASLLVHEICHSLVARGMGMPVAGITLFIFGGVSQLEDEPPTAAVEFFMAAVGPISSVLLGMAFAVLYLLGLFGNWPLGLMALLFYLAFINFMLATFNSLPAFPLDGGRVLRSILWAVTGDLRLATNVAARIGSGFGLCLIAGGLFLLFARGPSATLPGVWFIIIGFFLRQAAASSLRMVIMRHHLKGEKVRRFMTTALVTVPPGMSLQHFADEYAFRNRFHHYPVVDDAGHLLGLADARTLRNVPAEAWPTTPVASLTSPVGPSMTLDPDTDAMDALSALRRGQENQAVVVEGGRPVGMVSVQDVLGYLTLKIHLARRKR